MADLTQAHVRGALAGATVKDVAFHPACCEILISTQEGWALLRLFDSDYENDRSFEMESHLSAAQFADCFMHGAFIDNDGDGLRGCPQCEKASARSDD